MTAFACVAEIALMWLVFGMATDANLRCFAEFPACYVAIVAIGALVSSCQRIVGIRMIKEERIKAHNGLRTSLMFNVT